jgi:hypothetical protein
VVDGGTPAIEADPGRGIDQFAPAVDKVGNPQRTIDKEDRDFTPLGAAQDLTLDACSNSTIRSDAVVIVAAHRVSPTLPNCAKG